MSPLRLLLCAYAILLSNVAFAQLVVTVAAPKAINQKVIIPLAMKNGLAETVQSARAGVLLFDPEGKMVGQAARWVIGGTKESPGLAPGATNVFNFVITTEKPLTSTNLVPKGTFSRI